MKIRDVLLLGILMLSTGLAWSGNPLSVEDQRMSKSEFVLRTEMRRLWTEQGEWLRTYIVSRLSDLPNAKKIASRLMRNQEQIGRALKPFYGRAAGRQMTILLKENINIIESLIGTLRMNDKNLYEQKKEAWVANANAIAIFLNSANPRYFQFDEVRVAFRSLVDLTAREINSHLANDWDTNIAVHEDLVEQGVKVADQLSDGLVKQFPSKF
jgi:hypothetical protein